MIISIIINGPGGGGQRKGRGSAGKREEVFVVINFVSLRTILCCTRMPTSSPKLQSTGLQIESGSVIDRKQTGEELWKRK